MLKKLHTQLKSFRRFEDAEKGRGYIDVNQKDMKMFVVSRFAFGFLGCIIFCNALEFELCGFIGGDDLLAIRLLHNKP